MCTHAGTLLEGVLDFTNYFCQCDRHAEIPHALWHWEIFRVGHDLIATVARICNLPFFSLGQVCSIGDAALSINFEHQY